MMEEKSLERIDLEAEAGMLIKRLTEEQAVALLDEILSHHAFEFSPVP